MVRRSWKLPPSSRFKAFWRTDVSSTKVKCNKSTYHIRPIVYNDVFCFLHEEKKTLIKNGFDWWTLRKAKQFLTLKTSDTVVFHYRVALHKICMILELIIVILGKEHMKTLYLRFLLRWVTQHTVEGRFDVYEDLQWFVKRV